MVFPQRLSDGYYRELFENAGEAIWIHDLKGNIIAANGACERLTGYSVNELLGRNVAEFLDEEGLSLAREVRTRLLKGEMIEQRYEQRLVRKDGTEAIMELATSLVVTGGQPIAFQHIARDVTEERRMRDSLRFYLQAILRAQEDERKRIARELHDETEQSLVLLTRRLDTLISDLHKKLSKPARKDLEQLHSLAMETCEGLRHYARNLRPHILYEMGLVRALEYIVAELRNEGIDACLQVTGVVPDLSSEAQLVMFRIAQEALSNTRRHAEASRAKVRLEFEEGKVRMTISDNGKGFELPKQIGDFTSTGRLGLVGMYERARLLAGTFEIQSKLGKGTKVVVELPLGEN